MMFADRRKAGSTVRLAYTAWSDNDLLVTGLTPLFRVIRESDGYLLDADDGAFRETPGSEFAMDELSAVNAPGRYFKKWILPATVGESYTVIVDGGATVANRHADCRVEAIAVEEDDIVTPSDLVGITASSGIALGGGHPVNIVIKPALTGTGADQAVEVPRGSKLTIRADADVEVRDTLGGNKITIPSGSFFCSGESLGQTVYLRAAVGTTIEVALM